MTGEHTYIYNLEAVLVDTGVLPESVNSLSEDRLKNTAEEFFKFKGTETMPVTDVFPYGFLLQDDNCSSNSSSPGNAEKAGFSYGSVVKIFSGHDYHNEVSHVMEKNELVLPGRCQRPVSVRKAKESGEIIQEKERCYGKVKGNNGC